MNNVSEASKALQDYFGFAQRHGRDPHAADTRDDYLEEITNSPAYTPEEIQFCHEQSLLVLETRINPPGRTAQPVRASGDLGPGALGVFDLAAALKVDYEAWCRNTDNSAHDYANVAKFLESGVRDAIMYSVDQLTTPAAYAVWHNTFSRPNTFRERMAEPWKYMESLQKWTLDQGGDHFDMRESVRACITNTSNVYTLLVPTEEVRRDGQVTVGTRVKMKAIRDMMSQLSTLADLVRPEYAPLAEAIDRALRGWLSLD